MQADLLHLHHLTPANEAAARAFGSVPVLGQVHAALVAGATDHRERSARGRQARAESRHHGWPTIIRRLTLLYDELAAPEGRQHERNTGDDRAVGGRVGPNGVDSPLCPTSSHESANG